MVALFPNTTVLSIRWKVMNDEARDLQPTYSDGQLQRLKRLNICLKSSRDDAYLYPQVQDAQMLIDHLRIPSLDNVTIKFQVSHDGRGYLDDLHTLRQMLCGIELSTLQRVSVTVKMPIRERPFPETLVSTRPIYPVCRFHKSY
jgi:hypothetical protein